MKRKLSNEDKYRLREYLITTQCFDSFNDDYTIEDWCNEFKYTENDFHKMHSLAKEYFRKKYIVSFQINHID